MTYTAFIGWDWGIELFTFYGTFLECAKDADNKASQLGEGAKVYSIVMVP